MPFFDFIAANKVVLLGAALAVSEALALVPGLKSNSIFQLVVNGLKSLGGK
jgi:hypothetical protein